MRIKASTMRGLEQEVHDETLAPEIAAFDGERETIVTSPVNGRRIRL